jgi:hypothetical protein
MNHQLFEDRIISEEPQTTSEKIALEDHLRSCNSCQLYQASWKATEEKLRNVQMVSPRNGFTERWQAGLVADLVRKQKHQSLWLLVIYMTGAITMFLLLGLLALPLLLSPEPLFLALALWITKWISTLDIVFDFISILLKTMNRIVPLTLWIGIGVALCSLSSLWFVAYRRLSSAWRIVR